MERELWRRIVAALRRLPRWRPAGAVYDNREVLAVLLWAALHDRAVLWACSRASWPVQAWRRRLPSQPTMSRRLGDPRLLEDLAALVHALQAALGPPEGPLVVDGKPLPVSRFSADPDAREGWGAGRHALGYKLHALVDSAQRLVSFSVRPMNEAECVCAAPLVARARERGLVPADARLLADASYDSNPLYAAAAAAGLRLIAPRRRPGRPLCGNREHHPDRLRAAALTEGDPAGAAEVRRARTAVERYFGTLATFGGGLFALPPWVRRLRRVRPWVGAKLAINAARHALRRAAVA
jgi:hypothetical protein